MVNGQSEAPVIRPLQWANGARPFWSVMIPVYNAPERYLAEALRSVLQQDFGPERMQIEVVDDCSPNGAPMALVRQIAGNRVAVHCEPRNNGLAGAWNRCIERAQGEWVHILHQDDHVLPGFYDRIFRAAELHPEVSLLATRCFVVDGEGIILGVTPRLPNLENGGTKVDDFFYTTPVQCPGIVVKRSFYEAHGGFRTDLAFTLDCEMWTRAIGSAGGLVAPEVLSCYRSSDTNESARLNRTADGLRDLDRLNRLFAGRYADFDYKKARQLVNDMAISQVEYFSRMRDSTAAHASLSYWRKNAPAVLRLRRFARKIARTIIRKSCPPFLS
jgi:glycosyltransferase involved in cell wall biosynthesis